jgi:hypothetical protein
VIAAVSRAGAVVLVVAVPGAPGSDVGSVGWLTLTGPRRDP